MTSLVLLGEGIALLEEMDEVVAVVLRVGRARQALIGLSLLSGLVMIALGAWVLWVGRAWQVLIGLLVVMGAVAVGLCVLGADETS